MTQECVIWKNDWYDGDRKKGHKIFIQGAPCSVQGTAKLFRELIAKEDTECEAETEEEFRQLVSQTILTKDSVDKVIKMHRNSGSLKQYILKCIDQSAPNITDNGYEKLQHFDEENVKIRSLDDTKRIHSKLEIFGFEQDELLKAWSAIPPEYIVRHPRVFPELYRQYSGAQSFGKSNSRCVIIDGSNVAFGHGKQHTGTFLTSDEYSHQQGTTAFSLIGIKLVIEELWRRGCFYYDLKEENNVHEILVTIPTRNVNGARVPPEQMIILTQLQQLGMVIEVDEPTFSEDLTILDYSMQTSSGNIYYIIK